MRTAMEVSEKQVPRREEKRTTPTCFVSNGAFGTHGSPSIKKVESPLTVANEEAPGVETSPALLLVHKLIKAMHDEVVVLVLLQRNLEQHVREHGITVHPPYPFHFRMTQHELSDQGELRPEPGHFLVQMSHVVEDLDVVETTVIDLVLDGHEKVVISHGILARSWLGACHQKHPWFAFGGCGDIGISGLPYYALLVPVLDSWTQTIRLTRIAS